MYLIKRTVGKEFKVKVKFEKVVEDLLMVSLTNQTKYNGILSYWRLVNVSGIPPLEIGIDCESRCLASINFYIDVSYIDEHRINEVQAQRGSVLVDTSIFSKTNDYVDVDKSYMIYIQNNKLICLFETNSIIAQSYRTDRLEVYLDSKNNILGFAICDLSVQERKILKSLH